MSFFTGFAVSAAVYILVNKLFPVPGASTEFLEIDEEYNSSQSHSEEFTSETEAGEPDRKAYI